MNPIHFSSNVDVAVELIRVVVLLMVLLDTVIVTVLGKAIPQLVLLETVQLNVHNDVLFGESKVS